MREGLGAKQAAVIESSVLFFHPYPKSYYLKAINIKHMPMYARYAGVLLGLMFLTACHTNDDKKLASHFVGNWSAIENHTLYLLTIKEESNVYHWEHWAVTFGVYNPNELAPKYWPNSGGMRTDADFRDSGFYSITYHDLGPIKVINDTTLLYSDGVALHRDSFVDSIPYMGMPSEPKSDSAFIGDWRPDYSWYEGSMNGKVTNDPLLKISRFGDHYFIQLINKKSKMAIPWHALLHNNVLMEPEGHHRMIYMGEKSLVLEGPAYYPQDDTRVLMTFVKKE